MSDISFSFGQKYCIVCHILLKRWAPAPCYICDMFPQKRAVPNRTLKNREATKICRVQPTPPPPLPLLIRPWFYDRQCSENCFMSHFSSNVSNICCSIEEIGVTKHSFGIFWLYFVGLRIISAQCTFGLISALFPPFYWRNSLRIDFSSHEGFLE